MSGQVDVLEVLDRGIADLMDGHSTLWTARDVKVMRAAVVELIEAATSARDQLRDAAKELRWLSANQAMHCEAISDHVDAAIALAQGVQS